jgi:hypothetical protein
MMRHDAKSLALFRAIHGKLSAAADPRPMIRKSIEWARYFFAERPEDRWLGQWIELLEDALQSDSGLHRLYGVMLDESDYGITMRSSSPFPGLLTVKERTQVLLDFERRWDDRRTA